MHNNTNDKPAIIATTLENAAGMRVTVLNYGAIISAIEVPVKTANGVKLVNTVLGYDKPKQYLTDTHFMGAMAGRFANRIANSAFVLDQTAHSLVANEGKHQLHGGPVGFSKRYWTIRTRSAQSVCLGLVSEHGDQGFPGKVTVELHYELTDTSTLNLQWQASTDQNTVINLTNHSYFNLAGHGDIAEHLLQINASCYTPTDVDQIPTGEICSVASTPLDFNSPKRLGSVLSHTELDHNWVIDSNQATAASLTHPESGLRLDVSTSQPGLQCYTGNNLGDGLGESLGNDTPDHPAPFLKHGGICLETQGFPNAPNQPNFASTFLAAGETIEHRTSYTFSNLVPRE